MSHQEELEKKKYRNWVRGGLAYKYLKEGIKGFADDVVDEEHRRINQDIISGRSCNKCSIRNLRPLHPCQKDQTGRNVCPWGQNSCNCLYTKKKRCPNKVCDAIMEEILKNHGSAPPSPNWKNTDIQKWCSAPWEIAKCFINAPGYSDKSKADDIDISGLLHAFINNISLKSHLSDNINSDDIFLKTLQRRNELFHSPTMEMEDSKLDECIDEIIAILEDKKELKARRDAQKAVIKLNQLKQENFIITTHNEVDVCRDALTSISNKAEELKQTIQDAKDDIAKKQAEATEAVGDETKKVLRDALGEPDNRYETLYERVGRLESDHSVTQQRLTELESRVVQLDIIRPNYQKQLDYVEGKQVLQEKLMELYQNHYVSTSISPLKLQENNMNIREVYVPPAMVVKEKMDGTSAKPKIRSLTGYRDMLQTADKKHKQIYIVGDVGTGKSTFCKMMIQDWCSAITEERLITANNDKLKDPNKSEVSEKNVDPVSDKYYTLVSDKECAPVRYKYIDTFSNMDDDITANINEMKNFDFLFFVPLQRITELSDITDMIKAIAKTKTADLASTDLIDRIFQQESERCLIVVDGLDEWTPPRTKSILPHVNCGLPERNRTKHATVVTFSRPSAKGILSMKCSECDQKIELLGIKSGSVKCFVDKYLSKFSNTDLSYLAFIKNFKVAELEHLEKTPLLLQQLVWLYGFGCIIEKSVSDTYCHLVNIMIGWSQNKEEVKDLEQCDFGGIQQSKQQLPIPLCRFPNCETNKRVLLSLASVAFDALTSETRSSTFGRSYLKTRGVSEDAITSLIKLGILTEVNCFDPTYETTRLEFIHISYLEFFAAVHVSSQYDEDKRSMNQTTVLKDLFPKGKSAADILQLSNIVKMICGLSPDLISELSKMISDIVSRDESMIPERNYRFNKLQQIQCLMFDCLSEVRYGQPMISLCDLSIDCDTRRSFLQSIIPEKVLCLHAWEIMDPAVWMWIVRLKRLQYLHINNIDTDETCLCHSEMEWLSAFIQETPLRCLSLNLAGPVCIYEDCEGHTIDLSKHDQLQILQVVDCHNVNIDNINTTHLEIVRSSSPIEFKVLSNASSLTELHWGIESYNGFVYTKTMDDALHTLHHLRKLRLENARFSTDALTVTPEMRNLEHIELDTRMSLKTWHTFVDSLLTLQQSVFVSLQNTKELYVGPPLISVLLGLASSHETYDDPYNYNYVRQNKMFEVIEDSGWDFKFRTKK